MYSHNFWSSNLSSFKKMSIGKLVDDVFLIF